MLRHILSATFLILFWLSVVSIAQNLPSAPSRSEPSPKNVLVQDFSRSVVPITAVKVRGPFVQAEFGTGFCLDPQCYFIGTNYHVAAMMKHPRVKGAKVIGRFLATGPNDEDATLNRMASDGPSLRYTRDRDLAIFRLAKPLRNHHGLQFSTEVPKIGERVDIYSYPKGIVDPFRTLQEFHGDFRGEDTDGLMAIRYTPNDDKRLGPGASGGIVVDSKTGKVVGILCAVSEGEAVIVLAVPIQRLAEFLNKTQPFLAESLFPLKQEASPDEADFYPRYRPEESEGPPGALQRRTDVSNESDAVSILRERAQSLADGMRDFIAVQTYVWGSGAGRSEAADAYEVQVRSGSQLFREYPDGKKWRPTPDIPGTPTGVTPGDEWSTLPLYIGTAVGVKIREAAPVSVDGRRIRIFQYSGSAEDEPCWTRDIYDFVFFSIHRDADAAPYGEVWTDAHENIVRMSLHCEDHGWGWGNSETIVTYGWLAKSGLDPRLVPVSIVRKAKYGKKMYWCRGQFVDYREFAARARILSVVGVQ